MSRCPYCRKEIELMEVFQEDDNAAILQLLPSFGRRYSHYVMGYCYLFGVSPMKLKAKKLRILLTELKSLFDTESFVYQKRTYRISHAGIAEALDIVTKKNWPDHLSNHNYLKRCMISISEREAKEAGRQAERDMRGKEAFLQAGIREKRPVEIDRAGNMKRIGDILKSLDGGGDR